MPESLTEIRLADYRAYPYRLDSTTLVFEIGDGATEVASTLNLTRSDPQTSDLRLDGVDLELLHIDIDGRELSGNEFAVDDEGLTVFGVPETFALSMRTRIVPENNTALEGLYKSSAMYCTQCEAEGFRKITYYPDRPDVQTKFTTTVVADGDRYPVLLSNGNLIAEEELDDGRRSVTWHDPFNKPSYLFALVAGDLAVLRDSFTTESGREVRLEIYSEPHNIGQCDYAMDSLKRAMRWDEQAYGREYDLDVFMIVAVEDFNMGAMENKGLNVFNTSCVLASPDTATDVAYQRVEGVVAHEYFHNWSGNRVTCRDWFQLSLKEGFTVFRDAQFSAAMNSPTVKRIEDVDFLRSVQFAEDAGPLAHPVRPQAYVEISNFYTTTIYEKGAEVVGMLHTLLGADRFRRATDRYFVTHDGSAATTEDFVVAMEAESQLDLSQFRVWYSQSGTPRIAVREERKGDELTIHIEQSCPPTPGQPEKSPFHIPITIGLVDSAGRELVGQAGLDNGVDIDISTALEYENPNADGTLVVHMTQPEAAMRFAGVPDSAQVSFLRGFSAPVVVDYPRSAQARRQVASSDSDGYARWDAAQSILVDCIAGNGVTTDDVQALFDDLSRSAIDADDDGEAKALLAAAMDLPRASLVLDRFPGTDIETFFDARDTLHVALGAAFESRWEQLVQANATADYRPDGVSVARRALKNRALGYLLATLDRSSPSAAIQVARSAFDDADNLTDRLAAYVLILDLHSIGDSHRDEVTDLFYQAAKTEPLVVDKWFTAQASCVRAGGLDRVKLLEQHDAFDPRNPNKVRALISAFATYNEHNFHERSGTGYAYIADKVIELDSVNPQVAARLATQLTKWQRTDPGRQALMRLALERVVAQSSSKDVSEVASKGLGA